MVTIKEIAEMAGVSTTTVSNVLHKKTARVSANTIEKVEKNNGFKQTIDEKNSGTDCVYCISRSCFMEIRCSD